MREKFTYVPISNEEYDRQQALYGPFAQSVRELLDATIRTTVDEDTVRAAQASIEAVTASLRAQQLEGPFGVRYSVDGRGQAWGNPAIGLRNAFAPPLKIERRADGRCVTEFDLGAPYEGPPGHVHGGVCALMLDHILGEAASDGHKPAFTGTISCKYLRGTPLGALRAEAYIERVDGVKTFARGFIADEEGPTVEAEGVFILPSWARDTG
ncbi:MAG: PaaI family thioesterase [Mycobacterium sp.]